MRGVRHDRRLMATVVAPVALAAPAWLLTLGVAAAQVAPDAPPIRVASADAPSNSRVEEVIVTARKREESVQKVPIAITALSGQLRTADVRNLTDVVAFTPNVRIDPTYQRANAPDITIRGVGAARLDDNSLESPIGVFIDGVYLGTLPGQLIENFDLSRIEVLRGPQGTLFGRNTVGGALNVIRTEPTGDWGAKVSYTTGSWNDQEFRGVLNAPIIKDVLAAKLFFISENRDGYVHNTFLNINQPQKDYKNYGLTLKFTPNDRFKALLTAERYDDRSQGSAYLGNYNFAPGILPAPTNINDINASGGFLDCFLPGVFGLGNVPCRTTRGIPSSINTNLPNPGHVDTFAYTLNMSEKISDNFKLVSITGYRTQHEQTSYDFDGSSDNLINISTDAHYHQFSEELRAEGNWDTRVGKIALVTGAFYYNNYFKRGWTTGGDFWNFIESLSGINLANDTWLNPALAAATGYADPVSACLSPVPRSTAPGATPQQMALAKAFGQVQCDPGATGPYGQGTVQKLYETQGTDSVALFAHGEWEFYPHLTLTAGVRWTYEKKNFVGYQSYLAPLSRADTFAFPGSTGTLSKSWNQVTPTVALSYQVTPDNLVYGSFSEGWHSGGFFGVNQNISDFNKTYDPETSQSFEIGSKNQFFANRVQFNLTGFLNDFHNKQEAAVALDPTTNTVVTVFTNVGGVRYEGVEAELQWVVTPQLHLAASAGYLHASYTSLNIAYPNAVNANVPVQTNATFLKPTNSPNWTLGGEATYTTPVGPGDLELESKVAWVDSQYDSQGLYNESYNLIPAHTDLSASISYAYKDYKVTVFGRNLTNWRNETPFYIATIFASSTWGPGASWGLELAAKF